MPLTCDSFRPGVPLLSLTTSSYQQYLRPHLASFYSDWFLRYTSITRATATRAQEDTGNKEETQAASSSNTECKENRGKVGQLHQHNTPDMIVTGTNMLLETAACDGPVQFHRIVNKHFAVDLKPGPEEGAETGQACEDEELRPDTGET